MGVKSKVRSMQRGTLQRERAPQDKTPDYANFDPIMSYAEGLHFGSEAAQRDDFLAKIDLVVRGFVKAGFSRPADLSRLLNKRHIRTLVGDQWSPRLCSFLKKELTRYRQRETDRAFVRKAADERHRAELEKTRRRANPTNLSDAELQRRMAALRAFNAMSLK